MAARPRLTVKFVYYHPNLCCSCKARYRLLVAGGLTPLDAAEAAPWRSYAAGYCAPTKAGSSDCATGASGSWKLTSRESASLQGAADSCLRRCRECGRCRFISVSAKLSDCSWFHDCPNEYLHHFPRGFMSVPVERVETPEAPEPVAVPAVLPRAPPAWRAAVRDIRDARRRELQDEHGLGLAAANASGWLAYLSGVYGATTLQFPFMLSHLEFFYTWRNTRGASGVKPRGTPRGGLPRHFYDAEDERHQASVTPRLRQNEPHQGDVYLMDGAPLNTLFRYLHPSLAPYMSAVGKGRRTPPFAYSRGFPNNSKVEGVHTGKQCSATLLCYSCLAPFLCLLS